MSRSSVITVDGLSKGYRIINQGLGTVGWKNVLSAPLRNLKSIRSLTSVNQDYKSGNEKQAEDVFWALRDLSFSVQEGEILGIVGKNGAGKSTLLKILSRITAPTKGRIEISGRVSSLLEVGTGFHPELTGRENIYMNGTLHGMSRQEINQNLDEIIDFSGVENFLDTPIKRYSSGMRVRLGFAVAAFLEPEILIIDEVLAVGDAEFRRKCTGKMNEVSKSGRTILFVSHNMSSVESLCTRCLYLRDGQMVSDGETTEVIGDYLKSLSSSVKVQSERNAVSLLDHPNRDTAHEGPLRLTEIRINPDHAEKGFHFILGEENRIQISYQAEENLACDRAYISCIIRSSLGEVVTFLTSEISNFESKSFDGLGTLECVISRFPLRAGEYILDLMAVINGVKSDLIHQAVTVPVWGETFYSSGILPSIKQGNVFFDQSWSFLETS